MVHTSSIKFLIKWQLKSVQLESTHKYSNNWMYSLESSETKSMILSKPPCKDSEHIQTPHKSFFFLSSRKHLMNSNKHTKNEVTCLSELHLMVPSGCYYEEQTTALGIKLSAFWISASRSPSSLGKEVQHYLSGTP